MSEREYNKRVFQVATLLRRHNNDKVRKQAQKPERPRPKKQRQEARREKLKVNPFPYRVRSPTGSPVGF